MKKKKKKKKIKEIFLSTEILIIIKITIIMGYYSSYSMWN